MTRTERKNLADRLARQGIAIGRPQPIDTTQTEIQRMTMQAPTPQTPTAPSPADTKKIAAVAAALGTDPSDLAATLAAAWELLGPFAEAETAARALLSASELRAVAMTPGASAVGYLSVKRSRGAK